MRRPWCISLLVVLLLGGAPDVGRSSLACTYSQAQPERGPESLERALSRVPRSAELVVVADGLSGARRTKAVTGILDLLGVLRDGDKTGQLRVHWAALAELLGWNEDETFDRLLGGRVVLVSTDLETAGREAPWVLLSEIAPDTDERLRTKIPIAPRKAVDGIPVFALERGEYEMATVRVRGDADAERVMLLVGPTGRAGLFDTMVGALRRGIPDSLAAAPVMSQVGAHRGPGVLVALRVDQPAGLAGAPAAPAWSDFIVCTATPDQGAWECRLTLRDSGVRDRVKRVQPTSDAPWRALSKGSLLAVLETRLADDGASGAEGGNLFERLLSMIAIPRGSAELFTGRQALAVWSRAEAKDAASSAEVCVAFALETSDTAKLAPVGDKHLSGLVSQIEKALGGSGEAPPDFQGVACQAVRSVPLQVPTTLPVARAFGGSPRIAWSYPPATEGGSGPGWWQVCVSGTNAACADDPGNNAAGAECAAASRRMVSALQDAGPGETERWVSIGSARPAVWAPFVRQLVSVSEMSKDEQAGVVGIFERVAGMTWRLRAGDNGDVVGTLRLEMR